MKGRSRYAEAKLQAHRFYGPHENRALCGHDLVLISNRRIIPQDASCHPLQLKAKMVALWIVRQELINCCCRCTGSVVEHCGQRSQVLQDG